MLVSQVRLGASSGQERCRIAPRVSKKQFLGQHTLVRCTLHKSTVHSSSLYFSFLFLLFTFPLTLIDPRADRVHPCLATGADRATQSTATSDRPMIPAHRLQPLVVNGDGKFSDVRVAGRSHAASAKHAERLQRHFLVVTQNEDYSSKFCSTCGMPMLFANGTRQIRTLHCFSERCTGRPYDDDRDTAEVVTPATRNRDRVAAVAAVHRFVGTLLFGEAAGRCVCVCVFFLVCSLFSVFSICLFCVYLCVYLCVCVCVCMCIDMCMLRVIIL